MKILKSFFVSVLLCIFYLLSSVNLTSCTKTHTQYDTTFIIKNDTTTIIKPDTIIVKDSIYDIADGLVAYYNFNGGNLNDSSGFGNNIIFNNATTAADRFGNADNAYSFNGTSDYMRVSNSQSLNPANSITLMAIIKVNGFYTGACSGNQIFGKDISDGDPGDYIMRFSDFVTNSCSIAPNINQETFGGVYSSTVGVGALDTPFIKTGVWYNLTFTYNGIQAKFYINGQLKKTWSALANFIPNTDDLFIGSTGNFSQFPYWFNGVIDEIRIYNRALPYGAVNELNQLKE